MANKNQSELPCDLARGRDRFAAWRRARTGKGRIPDRLWAMAVRLAGKHGIHRTAQALKLRYYSLKNRVEASNAEAVENRAEFVEISPAFATVPECVIEFEDEAGRLRVHLKGFSAADVAAVAHRKGMSNEERLRFHQAHSEPAMTNLYDWLKRQFDEKLVEPNSVLGGAIQYMLKHWEKLTLFLRKAGAPLDNNICERALKKAILHRKNSLFYRSRKGALIGDLYMSLIHTCELNAANPFDYLTELSHHAGEVAAHPESWMPWNYRPTPDNLAV